MSQFKVIGELKNFLIRMSSKSKIHQTIDIIIVDILDTYGILIGRDWSSMIKGYFSIDWSHLWLPYNGNLNEIKIYREIYMKHVVKDLNYPIEPIMFNYLILGNYYCDSFFGNYTIDISSYAESNIEYKILHCTEIVDPHCNMLDTTNHHLVQSNIVSSDRLEVFSNLTNHTNSENNENYVSIHNLNRDPNMWTLFFDGSKYLEGTVSSYILKDPNGNKVMIACRLEFQCIKNIVEYEALLQGLRKSIDLGENKIKVFGNSKIVMRKVRNTIHYLSSHIEHYRKEVCD
jgi:hypothetical protein